MVIHLKSTIRKNAWLDPVNWLVFLLVFTAINVRSQDICPDKKVLYKVKNGDSLYFHVFKPETSETPTSAIVFFFGGGWTHGNPNQFYQQAAYFASRGMLAISAEYRIGSVHGTSPFACVEDGKSAVRWIRQHAKELNIAPDKIVASGGSAGGHVAICTALIRGKKNEDEDLSISSVPNAVVGFNPVFDTTEKGYGSEKVVGRETEISPCHQVKKDMPPMLNFHGKVDKTVPFENADRFNKAMIEVGNDSELIAFEEVGHGLFNGHFFRRRGNKYYNQTMYDTDVFLTKRGFLKGQPKLIRNIQTLACVGDSNTEIRYPEYLQDELGNAYQVENYGKGGATLIEGSFFPYLDQDQFKASRRFNADITLIMLGTNDANPKWCLDSTRETTFEGTPQEEFKSRYIELIDEYQEKNTEAQIYLLTPLPIWQEKNPTHSTIHQRKEQLNQWVLPTIKEIAVEQHLPLIDVHLLMQDASRYSADGVHLDDVGYKILAKKIAKEIN